MWESKRTKLSLILVIICGPVFIASLLYSQKIKITNENGVTVVYNPKKPRPPRGVPRTLFLKEDLSIGENQSSKEPLFFSIRTVRVDDEENIYVLDSRAAQIKVFDKDGNHLRNIGKKGQGPGEMQNPSSMEILNGKDIVIYDLGNGRISIFSFAGDIIKEIPAAKLFPAFRIIPDSTGNFIVYKSPRDASKSVLELKKYDENLETILNIARIEHIASPQNILRFFIANISFSVLKDDSILWGNSLLYQLHLVNQKGQIVKRIIKDYNPIKITEGLRKRETEERIRERGIAYPPELKLEFPDRYPAFEYFEVSDAGQIFVRTYERTDDGGRFYDIFDQEGKYVAKVPLKIRPRVWKKNKIYAIEEDKEGYQIVKRYQVEWKS